MYMPARCSDDKIGVLTILTPHEETMCPRTSYSVAGRELETDSEKKELRSVRVANK